MEEYRDHTPAKQATLQTTDLLGKRVLATDRTVVGKVKSIHLEKNGKKLAGLTITRLLHPNIYIGEDYIAAITKKAVKLNILPAILLKGRKVISSDGKILGKLIGITRVKSKNTIAAIELRRFLIKKYTIKAEEIKHLGASIILKKKYDDCKSTIFT